MNEAKVETGAQLLARLGSRPSINGLEELLFKEGPSQKDVFEFYGPEGTGKTELLLNLVTSIILPKEWKGIQLNGANANVIFIDTDYKFQILRLVNIMEKKITKKTQSSDVNVGHTITSDNIETLVKECLKKINIVRCSSSYQLLVTLHSLESTVSSNPDIIAIMIDSISAFYWIDRCNGGENLSAQETNMKHIVTILSKLINIYNLVIFATKAVNFKKTKKESDHMRDNPVSPKNKVPKEDHAEYLCKSWHKFVKHRLIFQKLSKSFSVSCSSLNVDVDFFVSDCGLSFE